MTQPLPIQTGHRSRQARLLTTAASHSSLAKTPSVITPMVVASSAHFVFFVRCISRGCGIRDLSSSSLLISGVDLKPSSSPRASPSSPLELPRVTVEVGPASRLLRLRSGSYNRGGQPGAILSIFMYTDILNNGARCVHI
jgi:hypothetical protein